MYRYEIETCKLLHNEWQTVPIFRGLLNTKIASPIRQGGGEIAQSVASLSTKRVIRVRARLDPLVLERWNSITVLLTRSHQC